MRKPERLSVLSHGMGQDSAAMLNLFLTSREFRQTYMSGRPIVIHGATLNEHPETDAYLEYTQDQCNRHGIEFLHVTPDQGYHRGAWKGGLLGQFRTNNTIGSVKYPKTCSPELKTVPIWMRLEALIESDYGYPMGDKRGLKEFTRSGGAIDCLIGIEFGEERRRKCKPTQTTLALPKNMLPKKKKGEPKFLTENVRRLYPLIDLKLDRAGCQRTIRAAGAEIPSPSNCLGCPFKNHKEILRTAREYPDFWKTWCSLEQNKIDHWAPILEGKTDAAGRPVKNYGVKGETLLPQYLDEAEQLYGHLTTAQLRTSHFTRGHDTSTTF